MTHAISKKKVSFVGLFIILMSLFISFVSPVVSFATGFDMGGNMTIQLDENGGVTVGGNDFKTDRAEAWNNLLSKYQGFIAGISGIGTATMVVLFIVQFLKLGASSGNPNARSQALMGCLWTGIAAAGLGAVTLIVGFFYRAI